MPPKRAVSQETQAETQACTRYRQAIDEVAEEYVCPITAELPIDPVTAEDGRCYERCAIAEWFERQPQPRVKSPVTNESMGKRLFPAVQVRNSLKRLACGEWRHQRLQGGCVEEGDGEGGGGGGHSGEGLPRRKGR